MAAKKQSKRAPRARAIQRQPEPIRPQGASLTPEALADLHYLEPLRSRNRLLTILEELYTLVFELRQMHAGDQEPK
jgi:hypothetical protein